MYICYVTGCDAIQDLMKASSTMTMVQVVLPDKMELKVYIFTDETHEQVLAHVMKSVLLIDKQLHHFDQLKKADTVLEGLQEGRAPQAHQEATITGKTPSNEEKYKVTVVTKKINKLDKSP